MLNLFVVHWMAFYLAADASSLLRDQQQVNEIEHQDNIERLHHEIEKVDRAIQETKRITRKSLDAPALPDLFFHLAELYVERSRLEYARGIEQQGQDTGAVVGERSMLVQLSKKLAIETYDKLLGDFPEYPRNDQVYFFKAHELRELGDIEGMFAVYRTMLEKWPSSRWCHYARMIMGDHHLEKNAMDEAENQYKQIIQARFLPLASKARYKLGVLRSKQEKYQEALELLRDAIVTADSSLQAQQQDGTHHIESTVRRDALLALVLPFTELRKPTDAPKFFRALANSKSAYLEVMSKLAVRYEIKGKDQAAAVAYREILTMENDAERTMQILPKWINVLQQQPETADKQFSKVEQDIGLIGKTYQGIVNRSLASKDRIDAPTIDEQTLTEQYEERARDILTRAQRYSQREKDKHLAIQVAQGYKMYQTLFPKSPKSIEMKQNAAGAWYEGNQYYPSGQAYELLAETKERFGQTKEEDIYRAIQAYHEALKEDSKVRIDDPRREGLLNTLDLMRAREGLKHLGSYFVRAFPESTKVPQVRFNIASMYYQQGSFRQSVTLFQSFIRDYPNHPDVSTAGNLALDALYKLEALAELAEVAEAWSKDNRITDSKFKQDVAKLADGARRRKVESAVIGTSDADFGRKMLAEWEQHKGSKEGEEFLYAGFKKFASQQDIANSQLFGEKLMGAYPSSKYASEILATLGNFAITIVDFERGAWLYEEFYKRFPRDNQAADLFYKAALIRYSLGEWTQAKQMMEAVRYSDDGAHKDMANQKILEILTAQQAWGELLAEGQKLTPGRDTVSSCFSMGMAALAQRDTHKAEQRFLCATRQPPADEQEESLATQARYRLAYLWHQDLESIEFIQANGAERILQQKLKGLQRVEQAYLQVIGGGEARWVLASSYQLARLYEHMAQFILQAPAPAGISPVEYKNALQQEADPYLEKAKTMREACSVKAEELRVISASAAACLLGEKKNVQEILGQPSRSTNAQNTQYQKDLQRLRKDLAKNSRNTQLLKQLVRLALQAKDYYYARLVLGRLQEIDSNQVPSLWLGLIAYGLNDLQEAAHYFGKGHQQGDVAASLNLAGLYEKFGLKKLAKSILPEPRLLQQLTDRLEELIPEALRLRKNLVGS